MPDSVLSAQPGTMAGQPILDHLPAASTIAAEIMSRFVVVSALPGRVPVAVLRREVTAMANACLEVTAGLLTGDDVEKPLADVRAAVREWAHEGVPIHAMFKAVHLGTRKVFDHLATRANDGAECTALIDTFRVFVELASRLSTAISQAYLDQQRTAHSDDADAVAAALIAGNATPAMARAHGVRLAESYVVFAVEFPGHSDASEPDRRVARRLLRRVRAEVRDRYGDHALMQTGAGTATLLIPRNQFDPAGARRLADNIAATAHTRIRATYLAVETGDIPEGAERASAVLAIMRRLRRNGLEPFDNLSLEYQLSRPGAAAGHLTALLEPLDKHPVLLETLTTHLASRATRLRTARTLHVHPNTVDYRLNRIAEITGLDPMQPDGMWRLRSALVARMIGAVEDEPVDPDQTATTARAC
ncbi:PucR family transcriptional regulator [Nocardia halotolerans]|uniref:PucR family transcriptional regulator n=1 Tax=Nocardia halotolerans TaxID=1755878 RepID=A0ABV8VPX6_9NOCA